MREETPNERQNEEIEEADVEVAEGELLPKREAMSVVNPGPDPVASFVDLELPGADPPSEPVDT